MLDKFKKNINIKKQSVSPLRKPPRLGGAKMKALSRSTRKKAKS